jgi:predicted nucleic acid-binding protein
VRSFVDSNVLVYADDDDEPAKQGVARALIEGLFVAGDGVVSLQVLREYFVVATGKLGIAAEAARRRVEIYSGFDLVTSGLDELLSAIDLHRLHGLSLWDALIVRAALAGRCSILYSEDLQHGHRYGPLRIENPFLGLAAPSVRTRRRKR